jgi:hypothetical protein
MRVKVAFVLPAAALLEERWTLVSLPLLVVLPDRFRGSSGLFLGEELGLIPPRKPPKVVESLRLDLFGDQECLRFPKPAVLGRVSLTPWLLPSSPFCSSRAGKLNGRVDS